ncbi:MAG: type II toxin-antitoxin system death-on-curing family toxin [Candidatus Bathyarchaeota archaeon]|nr:type II toxin-antitoxin system death-on-curing family toxin [Candidatus Bathyarchaeota archaeon]
MYCKYLTKKQVLKLHEIALKSGGAEGLLAEGMLELALETPHITFFGTEFHSSLSRKAAAIMHEVIKLHPFIDGNKRTGFLAADTFLRVNGYELLAPERNAIDLTLETSRCSIDIAGIARWIETSFRRRRIR